MNRKSSRKEQAGFTLLEMLISGTVLAVAVFGAYSLMSQWSHSTMMMSAQLDATNELQDLLDDIQRQYGRRSGFTIQPAPASNPIFNQALAPPPPLCQQQIDIFQQTAPAPLVTKTYRTQWVAVRPGLPPIAGLVMHPNLNVRDAFVPQVVTLVNGVITSTHPMSGIAMAICFRQIGTSVSIEGGAVFSSGATTAVTTSHALLSTEDHSAGVHYLTPN